MAARYLLVGYPGLVAQAVLRHLRRERPGAELDVLVETSAQADRLRGWLAAAPDSLTARIFLGQRTAIDLGLSGPDYLDIAAGVERLLWCVEPSRCDRRTLEQSPPLRSAAELVELLRVARRLEGAVFLSSIFALGNKTGRVLESELLVGQRFTQRMEEACAVGEAMVARAARNGPVAIGRAAVILGDGETGECPVEGPLMRLVRACIREPGVFSASFCHEPVHVVTADFVARALLALVHDAKARGRRIHLVEEAPPSDAEFLQWLATACERMVEERPRQGWRVRPQSPLTRLDSPEARALRGWSVKWDTREARELLPEVVQTPLKEYLPHLVAWCRSLHDRTD